MSTSWCVRLFWRVTLQLAGTTSSLNVQFVPRIIAECFAITTNQLSIHFFGKSVSPAINHQIACVNNQVRLTRLGIKIQSSRMKQTAAPSAWFSKMLEFSSRQQSFHWWGRKSPKWLNPRSGVPETYFERFLNKVWCPVIRSFDNWFKKRLSWWYEPSKFGLSGTLDADNSISNNGCC